MAFNDTSITFGAVGLTGESLSNPTALAFSKSGAPVLFVTQQNGHIHRYVIERQADNGDADALPQFVVTDTEVYQDIANGVQNYNDDGSINNTQQRQVTGLAVTTDENGNDVLYVSSSDWRIAVGTDTGLDTNSGQIHKIVIDPSGTILSNVAIIRGLPRSEENHSTNGLDLSVDANGDVTLWIAQGGNTNKGAPGNNFSGTVDFALSGTVLKVDLTALESYDVRTDANGDQYILDLPTLDDPTRANVDLSTLNIQNLQDAPNFTIDQGPAGNTSNPDFAGGNNGLNMAKIAEKALVSDGGQLMIVDNPLSVHAPGARNNYDVLVTEDGEVYSWDNGPNGGWGGQPLSHTDGQIVDDWTGEFATNEFNEGGSSGFGDQLHYLGTTDDAYGPYMGDANPIRASKEALDAAFNTDGSYKGASASDPIVVNGQTLFANEAAARDYLSKILIIYSETSNGVWSDVTGQTGLPADFFDVVSGYDWTHPGSSISNPANHFDGTSVMDGTVYSPESQLFDQNQDGSLKTVNASTNGLAEYTAGSFFGGKLDGAIIAAAFNGNLYFEKPKDTDGDGRPDAVDSLGTIGNFGSQPLAVTALGDFGLGLSAADKIDNDGDGYDDFAGLVVAATYGADNITFFVPGGTPTTPGTDLDQDGINNTNDSHVGDPLEGKGVLVSGSNPALWHFELNDPTTTPDGAKAPGDSIAGDIGINAVWRNGVLPGVDNDGDRSAGLYDAGVFNLGGASTFATLDVAHDGSAEGAANTQQDVLGLGFTVSKSLATATIETEMNNIFGYQLNVDAGKTWDGGEKAGFVFGPGNQDTFVQAAMAFQNGQFGLALYAEENNAAMGSQFVAIPGLDVSALVGTPEFSNPNVQLAVDIDFDTAPPSATARLRYQTGDQAEPWSEWVATGPVDLPGDVVKALYGEYSNFGKATGAFLGMLATADSGDDSFAAGWDKFEVSGTDRELGEGAVLYRVNAGGPQVAASDGGPDWAADNNPDSANLTDKGSDSVNGFNVQPGVTVAPGTPPVIFQTERWDQSAGTEMKWGFAVDPGFYEVRLYMGNGYNGTNESGERVFDVAIEGAVLANLDNIDLSSQFGHLVGGMIVNQVNVTDGTLDIEFIHGVENPLINGIEIVALDSGEPGNPTVSIVSGDQSVAEGAGAVQISLATDITVPSGETVEVSFQIVPGTATPQEDYEYTSGTATFIAHSGVYTDTISIAGNSSDATFSIDILQDLIEEAGEAFTVEITGVSANAQIGANASSAITIQDDDAPAPQPGTVLFRVNVGGPAIAATDGGPDWGQDQGNFGTAGNSPYLAANSGGNSTYTSTSGSAHAGAVDVSDPSIPAGTPAGIFDTERYDALDATEMQWQFPVAAGTQVEVRLYFAELFSGVDAAGERVFDAEIEGSVPAAFDDIDQFAAAGPKGAFMRSETVTVGPDGVLDLTMLHGIENPALKGIEILSAGDPAPTLPVATLSQSAVTVAEGAVLTVTVELDKAADAYPVTVPLILTPGDATAADYTATTLDVVIASGTTGSITIDINDDALVEGAEGFTVSIDPTATEVTPAGDPLAVTITEDDGPDPNDIDGDGLANIVDPAFDDASNGTDTVLTPGNPILLDFETAGSDPFAAGFTGLNVNPDLADATTAADPYGAQSTGGVTIEGGLLKITTTDGDSFNANNASFDDYGVMFDPRGNDSFSVKATLVTPADFTDGNYQAWGIQIGEGTQESYLKFTRAFGGQLQVRWDENDAQVQQTNLATTPAQDAAASYVLELRLSKSGPGAWTLEAIGQALDAGGVQIGGDIALAAPIALTGDILAAIEAGKLFAGIYSTDFSSAPSFTAQWADFSVVSNDAVPAALVSIADAPELIESGDTGVTTLVFTLSYSGADATRTITYTVDGVAASAEVTFTGGAGALAVDVANDDADNGPDSVTVVLTGIGDNVSDMVDPAADTATGTVTEDDASAPTTPIRIQGEDFDSAVNYQVQVANAADQGQIAWVSAQHPGGTATYDLAARGIAPGQYRVLVGHFDENDGASTITLSIGPDGGTATFSDSWKFDDDATSGNAAQASSFRVQTFENVTVGEDGILTIEGDRNRGEHVRIDYIEFIPLSGGDPDNLAPEAPFGLPTQELLQTGQLDLDLGLHVSDPEEAPLTFRIEAADPGADISWITVDGTRLTGTPGAAGVGDTTVRVFASDGVNEIEIPLQISVEKINTPPTTSGIGNQILSQGAAVNFDARTAFSDADLDPLTFTYTGDLPAGVSFENGVFSGAPTAAGSFGVTVTASDGEAGISSTFFFNVTPTSDRETLRIEAETFDLPGQGFYVESLSGGRQAIRLLPNQSGEATLDLGGVAGASGAYDVRVYFYDESDGVSSATLSVDPDGTGGFSELGQWQFNQDGGANAAQPQNLRSLTFSGLLVGADTVLKIAAQARLGEYARIDYIELVPSGTDVNFVPFELNGVEDITQPEPAAISIDLEALEAFDDPEEDTLSYALLSGQPWLTLENGVLTGTPPGAGSYLVEIGATDGPGHSGQTAKTTFTITVEADGPENAAPTGVTLTALVSDLAEDADTSAAIRVADIAITDDGLGSNALTLSGTDAALFEIVGDGLFLKAGTALDFETQTRFDVTVAVDDATVGATPDATADFALTITDVAETPVDAFALDGDLDDDTLANSADDDIDGDTILNAADRFAYDAANGQALAIGETVSIDATTAETDASPFALGFTGVLDATNPATTELDYATNNGAKVVDTAAGKRLQFTTSTGDTGGSNDPEQDFTFGASVDGDFALEAVFDNPFFGTPAAPAGDFEQYGLIVGLDSGAFVKFVTGSPGAPGGGAGFELSQKGGTNPPKVGQATFGPALGSYEQIRLEMEATQTPTGYSIEAYATAITDGVAGARTLIQTITIGSAALIDALNGVGPKAAFGITSTNTGNATPFTVSLESLKLTAGDAAPGDDAAPTARFALTNPADAADALGVTVTYEDASGIDATTLGAEDLTLLAGGVATDAVVTLDSNSGGVAQYSIAAPTGGWDESASYTVRIGAGEISDLAVPANAIAETDSGAFSITLGGGGIDPFAPEGDLDTDGTANASDPDVDGDNTANAADSFAYDADNGVLFGANETIELDFDTDGTPYQNGFTGLLQAGQAGTAALKAYDEETGTAIVSGGKLRVNASNGDTGTGNNPDDDYQLGIKNKAFTVEARVDNPFQAGAANFDQLGLHVGVDSTDFVKLVFGFAGGQVEFSSRTNDVEAKAGGGNQPLPAALGGLAGFATVDLKLVVSATSANAATVQGFGTFLDASGNPIAGASNVGFGSLNVTGALAAALFDEGTGVGAGFTQTQFGGADAPFEAALDSFKVTAGGGTAEPPAPTGALEAFAAQDDLDTSQSYGSGAVGSAVLKIMEGNNAVAASNFGANSFQVTNTGDKKISAIFIDVQSALFPDSVFDPDGLGGDNAAKAWAVNSGGNTGGYVSGTGYFLPGAAPIANSGGSGGASNGGFKGAMVKFDPSASGGFQNGETVGFSGDMDPNSIAGMAKSAVDGGAIQGWDVGGISGHELIGSLFTVLFDDGTTASGQLASDLSNAGSQALATQAAGSPSTVSLSVNGTGAGGTGTYGGTQPSVIVTGTPGDVVRITLSKGLNPVTNDANGIADLVEARLDRYDFKANNAFDEQSVDVTIGASGSFDASNLFDYDDANGTGKGGFAGDDVAPIAFVASVIDPANDGLPKGPVTAPIYLTNQGGPVTGDPVDPPVEGYYEIIGSGNSARFKVQFEDANGPGGTNPPSNWSYLDAADGDGNQSGFQGTGYYLWGSEDSEALNGTPLAASFLDYTIFVPEGQGGAYTMRVRASRDPGGAGDQQNDVWLRIDDDAEALQVNPANTVSSNGFVKVYGTGTGGWGNGNQLDGEPDPNFLATFNLTPGLHTITFAGRSQGYHLDFWELHKGSTPSTGASNSAFVEGEPGSGGGGGGGGTPGATTVSIAVGSDDWEQFGGAGSDDLELGVNGSNPQYVGLRFTGLDIPAGAEIESAYLEFEAEASSSGTANFTIELQNSTSAATYTSGNNPGGRSYLTQTVSWNNVENWTDGQTYRSADVSDLIEQLIGTNGLAPSGGLGFRITGTGQRSAESFEASGAAPKLVVTLGDGGGTGGGGGGTPGTSTSAIAASSDDREQFGNQSSPDLEFGLNGSRSQYVNMRFTGLDVPETADIESAYFVFEAFGNDAGAANFTIEIEDTLSAPTYVSGDAGTRSYLDTEVAWSNVGAWQDGQSYQSADISSLIEAAIGDGGLDALDALAFRVTGTGARAAHSFDSTGAAPQLVINYEDLA